MHRRTLLASAGALAAVGRSPPAKADTPGVTATEIKIGNTMPRSGPASSYGVTADADAAFFRMVNDAGGIAGRKISFISLDDAYSPPKTVEQTRRLVEEEGVTFMFQSLGTPTQTAVRAYLNARRVPQLFVAATADKFSDPEHFPWTIGLQPSSRTEATIYGKYLIKEKPEAKVGVLYQNDDYGKDYLLGLQAALGERYESMLVQAVSYETTDPTVDSQVISLRESGADVLVIGATPKAATQTIRKTFDMNWTPLRLLSFSSNSVGAVLTPAGLEKSVGLITVIYLKDLNDPQWASDPAMDEYRGFMKRYLPSADILNISYLVGYTASFTMTHVLRQCGDDFSRANIMRQAANLHDLEVPTLLPGVRLNTSPTNYRAIRAMKLARFNGKSWELFGPVISA